MYGRGGYQQKGCGYNRGGAKEGGKTRTERMATEILSRFPPLVSSRKVRDASNSSLGQKAPRLDCAPSQFRVSMLIKGQRG